MKLSQNRFSLCAFESARRFFLPCSKQKFFRVNDKKEFFSIYVTEMKRANSTRERINYSKFIIIIHLHLNFFFVYFHLFRHCCILYALFFFFILKQKFENKVEKKMNRKMFDKWKSRRCWCVVVFAQAKLSNTQCINYTRLIMDIKWQNKRRSKRSSPDGICFVKSKIKKKGTRNQIEKKKNRNENVHEEVKAKQSKKIGFHIIWIIFV